MKAKKAALARRPACAETVNLDIRYGKIGISAVAAAMRYRGEPRKLEAPFRERMANGEWRIGSSDRRSGEPGNGLAPVHCFAIRPLRRAGRR
jgi:hypothetical protein